MTGVTHGRTGEAADLLRPNWSGVRLLHSSLGGIRQVTAILSSTSDEAASQWSCHTRVTWNFFFFTADVSAILQTNKIRISEMSIKIPWWF